MGNFFIKGIVILSYWHIFVVCLVLLSCVSTSVPVCPPPEVAVRVYDPVPGWLDALLLLLHRLLATEHAQGEFVDSGLQHGAELPLHVSLVPPGVPVIRPDLGPILGFGEGDSWVLWMLTQGLSLTGRRVGEGNSGVLFLRRGRGFDLGPGPLAKGPRRSDGAVHDCSLAVFSWWCGHSIRLPLLSGYKRGEAPWTRGVPSTVSVFVAYHSDGCGSYHACPWHRVPSTSVLWLWSNSILLAQQSAACAVTDRCRVLPSQEARLFVVGLFARNGRSSASWHKFLYAFSQFLHCSHDPRVRTNWLLNILCSWSSSSLNKTRTFNLAWDAGAAAGNSPPSPHTPVRVSMAATCLLLL